MGGRQTVESSYRQLKSLTSGGLTRDAIAVRGLVRFALMFGPIVAAENVRRLVSKFGKFLDQSDGMLAHQLRWLDLASPVLKGIRIAAGLYGRHLRPAPRCDNRGRCPWRVGVNG